MTDSRMRLSWALFATFLCWENVWAQARLTITPLRQDRRLVVTKQLSRTLCSELECVSSKKVKRFRRQRVDAGAVLQGFVDPRKRRVYLQLRSSTKQRLWDKFIPLAKGHLPQESLVDLTREIKTALGVQESSALETLAASKPANPPAAPPEEVPPSPPATEVPNPAPRVETAPPASAPLESSLVEPKVKTRLAPRTDNPWIVAEAGVGLVNRSFSYRGLTQGSLRNYKVGAIFAPRLHLEIFPLARAVEGWLSGLALVGDETFSIGLQSAVSGSTGASFPSSFNQLSIGLRLKLDPSSAAGWSLAPELGYRQTLFTVKPSSDGTVLTGLPNLNYQGAYAGAAVDWHWGGSNFSSRFRADIVRVLRLHELVSDAYFPHGSTWGFEGELALQWAFAPSFSAVVSAQYTRYLIALTTQPSDAYVASGASDQYVSGSISLQAHF